MANVIAHIGHKVVGNKQNGKVVTGEFLGISTPGSILYGLFKPATRPLNKGEFYGVKTEDGKNHVCIRVQETE